MIVTSSWLTTLDPSTYSRIGISRGVPRGQRDFKRYTKLNPGPWLIRCPPNVIVNWEVLDLLEVPSTKASRLELHTSET